MPAYTSLTSLPLELHMSLVDAGYRPDELGDVWVIDDDANESLDAAMGEIGAIAKGHGHTVTLTDEHETDCGVSWTKVSVRKAGT